MTSRFELCSCAASSSLDIAALLLSTDAVKPATVTRTRPTMQKSAASTQKAA